MDFLYFLGFMAIVIICGIYVGYGEDRDTDSDRNKRK